MELILEQKKTTLEGKTVAYVEATLKDENYTYRVLFDKNTKKRFNAFARAKGFTIGEIDKEFPLEEKKISL